MRLVIQARMVSVEGKTSEYNKIVKIMEILSESMSNEMGLVDDSDEDENLVDISFAYDQEDFTIEQIKKMYSKCKKEIKG